MTEFSQYQYAGWNTPFNAIVWDHDPNSQHRRVVSAIIEDFADGRPIFLEITDHGELNEWLNCEPLAELKDDER